MNLNQLRVFHAVASLKSFTRASQDLFLTQPGISKHIKQLEEFFGIRLFDRLGKKVAPTQAGEILFEATKAIFELIDDAKVKIDDLKMMTGGKITIGASFTAGTYIIPEIMGRFNQMYPGVEFLLDISLSHRIAEKVIANELDVGFIGAPYDDERLVTKKFREDKLVIIIPKEHPWKDRKSIRLAELADQPFVISRKGSGTRAVIQEQMENAGLEIKKKIEFGNTETVKRAVEAGIGVSIISEFAIKNEVAAGQIKAVKLSDCVLKRTFYITYHKHKYRTSLTRGLIDLL
ncbi:MAG: selenium metabolism-associated LysR family transcriptional regulator [Thermodesulfobacteriota bacterium]|nr:selenium metabolism-associated LysR family transcriptional regulator [Thermodesulfobacteriota bacterium]